MRTLGSSRKRPLPPFACAVLSRASGRRRARTPESRGEAAAAHGEPLSGSRCCCPHFNGVPLGEASNEGERSSNRGLGADSSKAERNGAHPQKKEKREEWSSDVSELRTKEESERVEEKLEGSRCIYVYFNG